MTRSAILCVDDEPVILQSLKDQLRRHFGDELVIETAESGDEGLEVLDELLEEGRGIPLVVSDQLMPGMKGEEFLSAVHERDPRILNVLLTGQATVDAVGAAVNKARLYRYIAKPWDEGDLVLTVREALRAWNQARELEVHQQELALAHSAALRFVPGDMLALLGRSRVAEVCFGDHARRTLHVLLSDMRHFTSLLEGLDPGDAFAFLNQYMERMERAVREHGGFVLNTQGDQVLALFPRSVDDAFRAAVASFDTLDQWNAERAARGEPAVAMGLGLNTGELLLGTIGGEQRLQCDVVGDPVNICSRVEGATKKYDTRMLLTREALAHLSDPAAHRIRAVDWVAPKGFASAVVLYEVLDVLPEEVAAPRWAANEALQAGRDALTRGDLSAAEGILSGILDVDPGDGAAKVLLARCRRMQRDGLPDGWSGVTVLTRK